CARGRERRVSTLEIKLTQLETLSNRPFVDLFYRPAGMFANQRLLVVGRAFQGGQRGDVADVPQRDADVAQQSPAFGSQNRCAREPPFEPGLIEREQLDQLWLFQLLPRVFFRLPALAREPHPRGHVESIVAVEVAIAPG